MSDPKIVSSAKHVGRRSAVDYDPGPSWAMLGWVGLAFLVVGGVDFALVWFPTSFGMREWEFAAVTQSFNGLPILLLGVGLVIFSAERTDRTWWLYVGAGAATVLFVWVLGGFALWASNVGLALTTVPDNLRSGVVKAVAKTAVQSVVYSLALGYLVVRSWVEWRRGRAAAA